MFKMSDIGTNTTMQSLRHESATAPSHATHAADVVTANQAQFAGVI